MTNSSPVSNTTVADQKSAFGSTLFALSFMGGVIWNLTLLFLLTGAFGWIGSFACIGLGLYIFSFAKLRKLEEHGAERFKWKYNYFALPFSFTLTLVFIFDFLKGAILFTSPWLLAIATGVWCITSVIQLSIDRLRKRYDSQYNDPKLPKTVIFLNLLALHFGVISMIVGVALLVTSGIGITFLIAGGTALMTGLTHIALERFLHTSIAKTKILDRFRSDEKAYMYLAIVLGLPGIAIGIAMTLSGGIGFPVLAGFGALFVAGLSRLITGPSPSLKRDPLDFGLMFTDFFANVGFIGLVTGLAITLTTTGTGLGIVIAAAGGSTFAVSLVRFTIDWLSTRVPGFGVDMEISWKFFARVKTDLGFAGLAIGLTAIFTGVVIGTVNYPLLLIVISAGTFINGLANYGLGRLSRINPDEISYQHLVAKPLASNIFIGWTLYGYMVTLIGSAHFEFLFTSAWLIELSAEAAIEWLIQRAGYRSIVEMDEDAYKNARYRTKYGFIGLLCMTGYMLTAAYMLPVTLPIGAIAFWASMIFVASVFFLGGVNEFYRGHKKWRIGRALKEGEEKEIAKEKREGEQLAVAELVLSTCPYSQSLIKDPVTDLLGHSFENDYLQYALESGSKKCPVANEEIKGEALVLNNVLKTQYQRYQKEHLNLLKFKQDHAEEFKENKSADENDKQHNKEALLALEGLLETGIIKVEDFICPITGKIMNNPVVTASGVTVELSALEELLKNQEIKNKIPSIMPDVYSVPNLVLKRQIYLYKETPEFSDEMQLSTNFILNELDSSKHYAFLYVRLHSDAPKALAIKRSTRNEQDELLELLEALHVNENTLDEIPGNNAELHSDADDDGIEGAADLSNASIPVSSDPEFLNDALSLFEALSILQVQPSSNFASLNEHFINAKSVLRIIITMNANGFVELSSYIHVFSDAGKQSFMRNDLMPQLNEFRNRHNLNEMFEAPSLVNMPQQAPVINL